MSYKIDAIPRSILHIHSECGEIYVEYCYESKKYTYVL